LNEAETLTAHLPGVTARAARFIEQNWTLSYMEKKETVSIPAVDPPVVDLGAALIKKVVDWYYTDSDEGEIVHLIQVDPFDFASISDGKARYFYLTESRYASLDAKTSTPYDTSLVVARFTTWPDAGAPWLVVHGEDLLLCEVMIRLAPVTRDKSLMEMYGALKPQAIKSLLMADMELRESLRDSRSQYLPREVV
jgi:hypothetical protein